MVTSERRGFFRNVRNIAAGFGVAAALGNVRPEVVHAEAGNAERAEQKGPPFEQGKYQTFPRPISEIVNGVIKTYYLIDLGTLGPDVDTIFGIDFEGDIPTGALVIHQPTGKVLETRVVGIKRTDLETVQFAKALGGDRFDEHKVSDWGGDVALDARALNHAENTAREHQKVVYVSDLGLFQRQYGDKEGAFLKRIIRAQRWADASRNGVNGIPTPDFVNARTYNE